MDFPHKWAVMRKRCQCRSPFVQEPPVTGDFSAQRPVMLKVLLYHAVTSSCSRRYRHVLPSTLSAVKVNTATDPTIEILNVKCYKFSWEFFVQTFGFHDIFTIKSLSIEVKLTQLNGKHARLLCCRQHFYIESAFPEGILIIIQIQPHYSPKVVWLMAWWRMVPGCCLLYGGMFRG